MKYLKYFETEAEYNAFIQSEDFILPNVSYALDTDTVFYHVVKTGTMYTVYLVEYSDISGITYNEVDLGLPSGLKWADKNVGSNTEEDYGCYFAWGDTVGYKHMGAKQISAEEACYYIQPLIGNEITLTPDNIDEILVMMGVEGADLTTSDISFVKNKFFNWSDYFDTTDDGSTFNKYATNKLTVLETTDDAAAVNMGSDWRMPTKAEYEELINNTTTTVIDLDGNEFSQSDAENGAIAQYNLKGVRVTGTNGNSIFIPAAGHCINNILHFANDGGEYWSSSLSTSNSENAWFMNIPYKGSLSTANYLRNRGSSVRGVKA